MACDDEEHEEALLRRRFDEYAFKGMAFMLPVVLAISGWAFSLQSRLDTIATRQEERGPKIAALEKQVEILDSIARDPAPKPETRVAVEALKAEHRMMDERVDRIEQRVNNLHQFILNNPPKMLPRRGEMGPFKPDAG